LDGTLLFPEPRPEKEKPKEIPKEKEQEQVEPEVEPEDENEEDGSSEGESNIHEEPHPDVLGIQAIEDQESALKSVQERLLDQAKKKHIMAAIGSKILEDPETNLKDLKDLHQLCYDPDMTIKKLAMFSQLSIFKDIIPGYRIRKLAPEEKKVKVSKEVLKRRKYEDTLLTSYETYIKFLFAVLKFIHTSKRKNAEQYTSQALDNFTFVAVQSICQLLINVPHFNLTGDLLTVTVNLANSKIKRISTQACSALCEVFSSDVYGNVTLEGVKLISSFVKAKGYIGNITLLDTFLKIKITEDLQNINPLDGKKPKMLRNKKMKKLPKGKKKKLKEQVRAEEELRKAEHEKTKKQLIATQTQIVKTIFLCYFRILKKSQKSPLVASVLRGLAKFSHLISVEFMIDLLQVLKQFILAGNLSLEGSLQCIFSAFQTMKIQGDVFTVDLQEFYIHFYMMLLSLPQATDTTAAIPLALKSIALMLYDRKQLGVDRVAGFIKRLTIVATGLEPNGILAILNLVHKLLRKYPRTQQLFSGEHLLGVYHFDIEHPEHCNPFATSVYEADLLKYHWHPSVSKYARQLAVGADSGELKFEIGQTDPLTLYHNYDTSKGGFNPPINLVSRKPKRSTVPPMCDFQKPEIDEEAVQQSLLHFFEKRNEKKVDSQ